MQAVSLEDCPRKAGCSFRKMPQAFRSRSGLHHLGGPVGSGGGSKEDKACQARYHDGEMELHSTGDLRASCKPGLSHRLYTPTPLAIGQRGPEKQGGHFSGNPCLPGWRQHTAAPGKCFWKMGTSYMGGPKGIWAGHRPV